MRWTNAHKSVTVLGIDLIHILNMDNYKTINGMFTRPWPCLQGHHDHRNFSNLKFLKHHKLSVLVWKNFIMSVDTCTSVDKLSKIHQPDQFASVKVTAATDIFNGNLWHAP